MQNKTGGILPVSASAKRHCGANVRWSLASEQALVSLFYQIAVGMATSLRHPQQDSR